jgi:hypothetical protein
VVGIAWFQISDYADAVDNESVAQRVSGWFAFHTLAKLIHTLARYGLTTNDVLLLTRTRANDVHCIARVFNSGHSQSTAAFSSTILTFT